MKSKILLLYLNTGGGHLAPARAVADSINKNFGDNTEAIPVDGFKETNKIIKNICEDGYRYAQNNARFVWELLYGLNKIDFFAKSTLNLISKHTKKYIEKTVKEHNPEKIIIFHAFLVKPVCEVIEKFNKKIKVFTLVTDPYSPAPMWFFNKETDYIISNEKLIENTDLKEIDKEKIHLLPFPLNEKFKSGSVLTQTKTKAELGFDDNKPLILIIGGADGIKKGKKIVREILSKNVNIQIAVVCGKNKKLFKKLSKYKEKNKSENLTILGFINFVSDLLGISDIIITKAGTSTILEILVSGKVPLVCDYIWEQEKGNVDFVTEHKLGIYEKSTAKIGKIIKQLSDNKDFAKGYNTNISKMNVENGSDQISKFIVEYPVSAN